jgi:hypothetical protein
MRGWAMAWGGLNLALKPSGSLYKVLSLLTLKEETTSPPPSPNHKAAGGGGGGSDEWYTKMVQHDTCLLALVCHVFWWAPWHAGPTC